MRETDNVSEQLPCHARAPRWMKMVLGSPTGSALHVMRFLENLIRALWMFHGLRSGHGQRALHGYLPSAPPPPGAQQAAPLRLGLQRFQDGAGGHRQPGQADANGMVDGVGQGGQRGDDRYLAHTTKPVGMARVGTSTIWASIIGTSSVVGMR